MVRRLSPDELRILAIAASPPPATWDEYRRTRIYTDTADVVTIVDELERLGLVQARRHAAGVPMTHYIIATDAGRAALAEVA